MKKAIKIGLIPLLVFGMVGCSSKSESAVALESATPVTTVAPEETESADEGIGITREVITYPGEWYGVIEMSECSGFEEESYSYDAHAYTDVDENGNYYIAIYRVNENLEDEETPFMMMYVEEDGNEVALQPKIGDMESYVLDHVITNDDVVNMLAVYNDSMLDFLFPYSDEEGKTANVYIYLKVWGADFDDPMPQYYETYKIKANVA